MAQLQVGDKVLVGYRYSKEVHTIVRVTDKSAFSETERFSREYGAYIRQFGGSQYCTLATAKQEQDIKDENKRNTLAAELSNIKFYNLSLDQLNAILNIIKPQTNGTI